MPISNRDSGHKNPIVPDAGEVFPLHWVDVLLLKNIITIQGVN